MIETLTAAEATERLRAAGIRISRETRNEDGSFSAAADDALLQNQASADQESVVTSQYSDTRRTTYTLNLSGSGITENVLSFTSSKETVGEAGS